MNAQRDNAERDNADEQNAVRANMDYQFLEGHRFNVDGQVYEVCDILMSGDCVFVDAQFTIDGKTTMRRFPAATAIESLLVEEEIELFSPNFVFAAK